MTVMELTDSVEGVISRLYVTREDILAILDARDQDEFDTRWIASLEAIETAKANTPLEPTVSRLVFRLREAAYLATWQRWESSDLAAVVSDDFGVIGETLALHLDVGTGDPLLRRYLDGRIPSRIEDLTTR